VLLGLLIGSPAPAPAAEDAVDGGVDASGVTITIVRWQGTDRVHATGSRGGDDPSGCDWAVVPAPLGALPPSDIPPFRPDSYLGLLTCDGVGVEVLWVGPHNTVDLEVEARRLVEEYVAHVPVPALTVHANPMPAGLVGLESWFWATGYDQRPIVDRIEALGYGVDVRIEPSAVTWSFGDGTTHVGGLGEAYPARSAIRHGFTVHGTRPLRAGFALVPRYRIDDTDWIELPPIEVADIMSYRVQEAQAVVTG
jgi:hypothetical protein